MFGTVLLNMSSRSTADRKTITVHEDIHTRLDEAKPYDSMSFNEFLGELLKDWEGSDS